MCLWLPLTVDTHLAVHEDVKANPKHLEEVPVVGPILHEVPGKPWGRGEVAGEGDGELSWVQSSQSIRDTGALRGP